MRVFVEVHDCHWMIVHHSSRLPPFGFQGEHEKERRNRRNAENVLGEVDHGSEPQHDIAGLQAKLSARQDVFDLSVFIVPGEMRDHGPIIPLAQDHRIALLETAIIAPNEA